MRWKMDHLRWEKILVILITYARKKYNYYGHLRWENIYNYYDNLCWKKLYSYYDNLGRKNRYSYDDHLRWTNYSYYNRLCLKRKMQL